MQAYHQQHRFTTEYLDLHFWPDFLAFWIVQSIVMHNPAMLSDGSVRSTSLKTYKFSDDGVGHWVNALGFQMD